MFNRTGENAYASSMNCFCKQYSNYWWRSSIYKMFFCTWNILINWRFRSKAILLGMVQLCFSINVTYCGQVRWPCILYSQAVGVLFEGIRLIEPSHFPWTNHRVYQPSGQLLLPIWIEFNNNYHYDAHLFKSLLVHNSINVGVPWPSWMFTFEIWPGISSGVLGSRWVRWWWRLRLNVILYLTGVLFCLVLNAKLIRGLNPTYPHFGNFTLINKAIADKIVGEVSSCVCLGILFIYWIPHSHIRETINPKLQANGSDLKIKLAYLTNETQAATPCSFLLENVLWGFMVILLEECVYKRLDAFNIGHSVWE